MKFDTYSNDEQEALVKLLDKFTTILTNDLVNAISQDTKARLDNLHF